MEASIAVLEHPNPGFIEVVEIWQPTADGSALRISAGHYGQCGPFGDASHGTEFKRGQGLPGQVWATGRPVVLQGLVGGLFERVVLAADAGLGAGVGIPIIVEGELKAVVLMLLSVRRDVSGVVEVWERLPAVQRLSLRGGFHGALTRFAQDSQGVQLEQGRGLPGLCWSAAMPIIVEDVGRWPEFVRRVPAEADQVTSGIGIPHFVDGQLSDVVTFFGTRQLDLARRIEVWDTRETFPRVTARADALYHDSHPPDAPGLIGNRGLAGSTAGSCMPRLKQGAGGTTLSIPVVEGNRARAVVTVDL